MRGHGGDRGLFFFGRIPGCQQVRLEGCCPLPDAHLKAALFLPTSLTSLPSPQTGFGFQNKLVPQLSGLASLCMGHDTSLPWATWGLGGFSRASALCGPPYLWHLCLQL